MIGLVVHCVDGERITATWWSTNLLALAHRLAGTVRTGCDRSDGMRHAGNSISLRLHAGADRAGVNGPLVESVEQAVAAVEALPTLDRMLCRRSFEERFTTARMAQDYVGVYEALAKERISFPGRAALPKAGIPVTVPLPVAAGERPVPPPVAAEEPPLRSTKPALPGRSTRSEEGAPSPRPCDSDRAAHVGRPERPLSAMSASTLARWRTAGG